MTGCHWDDTVCAPYMDTSGVSRTQLVMLLIIMWLCVAGAVLGHYSKGPQVPQAVRHPYIPPPPARKPPQERRVPVPAGLNTNDRKRK